MKKALYFLYFVFTLFIITAAIPVSAATMKVVAETQENFSTANPSKNLSLLIDGDYDLPNGEYLPHETLISGTVVQVIAPKRGKRDAYAYMKIDGYKLANSSVFHKIDNPNAIVKISKYKPLDIKMKSVDLGVTAAGFFVKNISYPINFVRGTVEGIQDGENPLVSGAKMTYEKSFFSYASKGSELEVPAGSKVIITITYTVE